MTTDHPANTVGAARRALFLSAAGVLALSVLLCLRRLKPDDDHIHVDTRLAWAGVIVGIVSVLVSVVGIALTIALAR